MITAIAACRRSMLINGCRGVLFHPITRNQPIQPLAQRTTLSRGFSTQWTSHPRVFPGFDLSLLSQGTQKSAKHHGPKAINTYPAGDEEVLNDKYQIFHKIGYGPTSTVWLAIDLTQSLFVVLKIYVVQQVLEDYGRKHAPKTYPPADYPLRRVLDRFVIKGPEGNHICMVHEAPALEMDQMQPGDKLDLETMRCSIKQFLKLLDYLHTDCNLTARVHHVKYKEAFQDAKSEDEETVSIELLPGDGIPLLADFEDGDYRAGLVTKHNRSPEEILGSEPDIKIDIWAAAMGAWDFVSSRSLINARNEEGAFDDRVHIAELVALIGPPSPDFRKKMPLASIFWDEKGQWTGQAPIPDRSLESLAPEEIDAEDLSGFLQWMRKALQWDPADRPTALGLMRHEWMDREPATKKSEEPESSESASVGFDLSS